MVQVAQIGGRTREGSSGQGFPAKILDCQLTLFSPQFSHQPSLQRLLPPHILVDCHDTLYWDRFIFIWTVRLSSTSFLKLMLTLDIISHQKSRNYSICVTVCTVRVLKHNKGNHNSHSMLSAVERYRKYRGMFFNCCHQLQVISSRSLLWTDCCCNCWPHHHHHPNFREYLK